MNANHERWKNDEVAREAKSEANNGKAIMTYDQDKEATLNDPATSFWLRSAINAMEKRDPIDAFNDATALAALMEARKADAIQKARELLAQYGG